MPTTSLRDPWLPRQLPPQLAALGALYGATLDRGARQEERASVGWRLHAALSFACGLAPMSYLAGLTGLTVEQLVSVLSEFAPDGATLDRAA